MRQLRFLTLIFTLCWLFNDVNAQLQKQYMYLGAGIGSTNYQGDLDDNWTVKFTKPGFTAYLGYKFSSRLGLQVAYQQGWMGASDAKAADDVPRIRRNLSFRSPINEVSLTFNYEFIANSRTFKYRARFSPYVFAGIAAFRFNPKAEINGELVALQPLGTEGQYLDGCADCPDPYKLMQISIPFGAGVRAKLTKKLDLRVEMGIRKTFTDYLDDVSGNYPDLTALAAQSPLAAAASDPSDAAMYPLGMAFYNGVRGNADRNDWYINTNIILAWVMAAPKMPKFR
ncbi:MAG: DUF6089 family protein [Bacteroidota bacterium]